MSLNNESREPKTVGRLHQSYLQNIHILRDEVRFVVVWNLRVILIFDVYMAFMLFRFLLI